MSNNKFRIAVWVGGLALAITLGRFSTIPVDIYESASDIGTIGAGLAVTKRTWDVMRRLGFEVEMNKRGFPVPKEEESVILLVRRSDQPQPGDDICRFVAPYNTIPLHRMHLIEMLRALLPANCTIHTSKRFTSYTRNSDGSLTLHFADGSTAVTDILVGADGIHSAVRSASGKELAESGILPGGLQSSDELLKSIQPKWTGAVLYRSLISPEKLRRDHSVWTGGIRCYSGKGKHFIAYPISNGAFINFLAFCTVPDGEGTPYSEKWVADAPKEEVIAQFVGWEPDVQELLLALNPMVSRWAPHVMDSVPFAAHSQIAILGDAMHAMTPHLSAGAGQAIEDAYILGRLISHECTTLDNLSVAFKIYEDLRLSFTKAILARSREAGLMYEFNGPEYDGSDRGDKEAIERWRQGILERSGFLWNEDPERHWEEAERRLRAALENK